METMLHLIKISVIVSCVVLALVLLKPVLNRRYHAKWKYYVWLCLAVVLLIPLSPFGWKLSEVTEEYAPIQITVPDIDRVIVVDEGETMPSATPLQPSAPLESPEDTKPQTNAVQPQTPVKSVPERNVEEIAMMVWLMGMAGFAAYYAVGTALFYRRAMRWGRKAEEDVIAQANRLMAEMKIRRAIPVLVSEGITSPMMIGFFRPRLLLSEGNYSAQELEFILRHELTHYKRRDLWYKLALLCANCVHWFNPFAYLLVREAAVDMELTCDDAVIAGGDAAVRRAYSETLLASLHRQSGMNVALSTFFYGGKETMKERFRNIMGMGRRRKGVLALCVVLAVTVAAACLIGCQVAKETTEELSEAELSEWQEKLESVEYNGFVTHMYSEAKYIDLEQVFYLGAGIGHEAGEDEVQAYLATSGMEELYTDLEAISAPAMEQFLMERVGLGVHEFAAPLSWTYVEEFDSYYFQHGDANFTVVEVLSGKEKDGVITLELADKSGATMGGRLTIADGKIVSYTNANYSAVEAMALTQVQELYKEGVTEQTWLRSLRLGQSIAGESGTYQEWWATLGVQYVPDAQVVDPGIDGRVNYTGAILVHVGEDNTVTMREAGYSEGEWHALEYRYMDLNFEEYVRYCCDMELTMESRRQGWPAHKAQLIYSIDAGCNVWTQSPQEVAKGWCLSMGDELAEYTVLDAWESSSESAKMDVLAQVVTKQGRTVRLLLSQVLTDFHDVSYWEVMGCKLVSGNDLPKHRVGEDTRSESTTLTRTLEGIEESVPVYLYTGGGEYGIGEWSMYIPYENWSCNYLTNRWCPNPEDMTTYIQVVNRDGRYSFEKFYDSYEQQFDQVWTNESQIELGANVAHAIGYQETAGGRYYESYLYKGDNCWYEVMWTYAAEAAEGWGARLGWTAATFGVIGDNTSYEVGELYGVTDDGPETVVQATDRVGRTAGTYMILPRTQRAYRLEEYLGVEKGVANITDLYGYHETDGSGMKLYSAESEGEPVYLGIAHDGKAVTQVVVVQENEVNAPDIHILGGTIRGMLEEKAEGKMRLVTADGSDPFVAAGTYMVLPGNNVAFRLENGFSEYADEWLRFQQMIDSQHPARYKEYRINTFTYACRYDDVDGLPMAVFSVDWDVKIDPPLEWKKTGEDGYSEGETAWLAVEYDDERVTRTLVMLDSGGRPGDSTFTSDMKMALKKGEADTYTTQPSIYYDRISGKLYAIHSNPNQSA